MLLIPILIWIANLGSLVGLSLSFSFSFSLSIRLAFIERSGKVKSERSRGSY